MYFSKPGKENTAKTLEIARDEAIRRGIKHVIVASTFGDTGLAAAEMLKDSGPDLIIVTHSTGFREAGMQTFSPAAKEKIEALGGVVYTGTMVLHGLGNALRDRGGYAPGQVVADSLRILGQGTKVAVEITAMCGRRPDLLRGRNSRGRLGSRRRYRGRYTGKPIEPVLRHQATRTSGKANGLVSQDRTAR